MDDESEPPLERPPERRHGLGLRAQIMVALGVGFALSVLLLGLATTELGSRAIDADRTRAAEATAEAMLGVDGDPSATLSAIVGRGGIVGAELSRGDERVLVGRMGERVVERRRGDAVVRIALGSAQSDARRALPGLLFLYVGITAAAILLLSYVLLTRSIVRPVEDLTRASERVANGSEHVRVPIRGAAEVARLALAFNEMQALLARDRASLRARLEELERTTRELRTAERSLVRSEKMASVGRLAAGVAHEIGNPLTSILGLIELVREGDLEPDEQRELIGRAEKETLRIHHIIRDLLDFARVEPASEEADASCDLAAVVEDAVRLVGPQKDLRAVTIERRFDDDCPPARGSEARLTQVVLNLLLNAADAIAGEGTIRVEVRARGDEVELSVSDTGPGIDEALLAHLFEPFVTSKPAGEGTGLGLAVCHTLIEQLGGTLEAENPPEGGARFTARLPAAGIG